MGKDDKEKKDKSKKKPEKTIRTIPKIDPELRVKLSRIDKKK